MAVVSEGLTGDSGDGRRRSTPPAAKRFDKEKKTKSVLRTFRASVFFLYLFFCGKIQNEKFNEFFCFLA